MKLFNLITFALFLLIVCSCAEYQEVPVAPMPVIEGYMVSGRFPVVLFSSSIAPAAEGSLEDALINWGKVVIYDGEDETILTGAFNDAYLPPYIYYTQQFRCVPGKRYVVKADYLDLHASAECTIPTPTPIKELTVAPTENDTLFSVTLRFISPDDVPAYYVVSMRGVERGDIAKMCPMSTIRVDEPGKECLISVMRPKESILGDEYVANFLYGEQFVVVLNRVERDVFDFWQQYDNLLLTGHSPFISSDMNLTGNVSGGFGIFSGQGADEQLLRIE